MNGMHGFVSKPAFRTVGSNGQLSLGKHLAGRQVQINEYEDGRIVILPGTFVPDSQSWLRDSEVQSVLKEAAAWEKENPPVAATEEGVTLFFDDIRKKRNDKS